MTGREAYRELEWAVVAALLWPEEWHELVMDYLRSVARACGATHCPNDIEHCLRTEKGTELEPMVLCETDYPLASLLAAIAFSPLGQDARFRVVSRDTLGDRGGYILTSNLKGYFSPCYAGKGRVQRKFNGAAFLPGLALLVQTQPIRTRIAYDSIHGFVVEVAWQGQGAPRSGLKAAYRYPPATGSGLEARLQNNSYLLEGQKLSQLGLNVKVSGESVVIQPGSSEAILRLTALSMQEALFCLSLLSPEERKAGKRAGDLEALYVKLALPEGEETSTWAIPLYRSTVPALCLRLPRLFANLEAGEAPAGWPSVHSALPGFSSIFPRFGITPGPDQDREAQQYLAALQSPLHERLGDTL